MVRPRVEVLRMAKWVVKVRVPQKLVRKPHEAAAHRPGWVHPKDAAAPPVFLLRGWQEGVYALVAGPVRVPWLVQVRHVGEGQELKTQAVKQDGRPGRPQ